MHLPTSYPATPAFLTLLVWRGVFCGIALYTALFKSFETMLFGLVIVVLAILVGESCYKLHVHRAAVAARKEREIALRAQRAEAARLRAEALTESRRKAREDYMNLGAEPDSDVAPPVSVGGLRPGPVSLREMSCQEFEDALLGIDVPAGFRARN